MGPLYFGMIFDGFIAMYCERYSLVASTITGKTCCYIQHSSNWGRQRLESVSSKNEIIIKWFSTFVYSSFDKRSKFHSPPSYPPGVGVVVIASAAPQQRLRRSDAVEVSMLFMTHIIQAIGIYNTLWFWDMVSEPHGCLYIEIYFFIKLFQVTIYFQYVHDYFNAHLYHWNAFFTIQH